MALDILRIPVLGAARVWLRLAPLPRRPEFLPDRWRHEPLTDTADGWWQIDLRTLALADGGYEYEFVVERPNQASISVADPYAEEITRFSGYRGVLRIEGGQRIRVPFSWDDELPASGRLPGNNELVIYELPMRWVDAGEDGRIRQVGLGTLEETTFAHLDQTFRALGVNAIELLPIQDSADTLNWGYGTRFFFATDFDIGEPFDLKLFVKRCHQRGMRVILDLVMNHARKCPLRDLAFDWFFLADGREEPDSEPRPGWGGDVFRYRLPRGGAHQARNFHFGMAEFLIREFHVDGFRLDEFKGIDNYDFVQDFTTRAHATQADAFPGRPFIVIAEDSWRRSAITKPTHRGARVVDAMWDFEFRDTVRRLVSNTLWTTLGQPSRGDLVRKLLSIGAFDDMARHVTYCTSHDVEADHEQRLFSYFMDQHDADRRGRDELGLMLLALEQVAATMALTLTAAGMPMFLAGEEFADLHDTDRRDYRQKMSDPVDWARADFVGRRDLIGRVSSLVRLRTSHAALQRNEVEFFGVGSGGFHPTFDTNEGERLFGYCRTAGRPLGSQGQVVVAANCSGRDYPEVRFDWPWGFTPTLREHGGSGGVGAGAGGQAMPFVESGRARFALRPFQVRVFSV